MKPPDEVLPTLSPEERARRLKLFIDLCATAEEPPPCKHCGRLVLAGACCKQALADARVIIANKKNSQQKDSKGR